MGKLVINHETFIFNEGEVQNANSLRDFIDAGNVARKNGDSLYGTEQLSSHRYTWGTFFENFAFKSYHEIRADQQWSWISQTLHQAYTTFFYQNPSGRFYYTDIEHFMSHHTDENCGTIGCACQISLDVFNIPSWHYWKIAFYRDFPEKFDWSSTTEEFLPNNVYSKTILEIELQKHNKIQEVVNGNIAQTFHDHVMRQKGNELRAYAVEIGTKIAEANYYTFEEELSRREEREVGAPRKIFSFVNRQNRKMYISIDHAHGMFEFHDHTGAHLGEFKFDGSKNSGADATHNLRTI